MSLSLEELSTEEEFLSKSEIPHIPAVISRIIRMASQENVNAETMAAEIQKEPGLVVRMLKIVNSSHYSLSNTVGTLSHAVAILGTSVVQSIALSASIFDTLFEKNPSSFFDLDSFWKRSFFSAIACRLMAARKRYPVPEEAFIVGLLHDVGILAMVKAESETYDKMCREKAHRGLLTGEAKLKLERDFFKTDHTRIGYLFAKKGNLPEFIQEATLNHHNPPGYKGDSDQIRLMTGITYLSDILTDIFNSNEKTSAIFKFKTMSRKWGGFNEKQSEEILYGMTKEIKDSGDIFDEISLENQKSYPKILQEANSELGKINLKFHQLNRELKVRDAEISQINKELTAEKERLSRELILAKNIHLSTLPPPIENPYIEMDLHYAPMLGVGGDSAAIYAERDDLIYFSIADVTGHGVAAALISTRLGAEISALFTKKLSPLEIIEQLNEFIINQFPDMGHYLTFFCGIFDMKEKKLTFAGAAHPPVIVTRESGKMVLLKSQNSLIGLDDFLRKKKGMGKLSLAKGDRLIFYTDGITERKNANEKELGIEGLASILRKNALHPVKGFARFIVGESEQCTGQNKISFEGQDDRMVVVFEVK